MPKQKTTKEEILPKAWRVLHRHGYHDTSLQMLATATGLGKAGLLHHFGSKRQLMAEVIDFARAWYAAGVLPELNGTAPLEQRLRRFLTKHTDLCQIDRRGCFFANVILETGADQLFAERLGNFHNEWVDRVTIFLKERYPTDEARERAYRLFADYEGSVVIYKIHGDARHLHRFVDRAADSLSLPIKLSV